MQKFLSLLFAFTWIVTFQAFGQQDERAKKILDIMSDKYQKIKAFKAKVKQEVYNLKDGTSESFTAEIVVKNDKYHLILTDQEILNDEKHVWTILKKEKEAYKQKYNPNSEDVLASPSRILRMYRKGFKYVYVGEASINGVNCDVIDLSPERNQDKKINYFKIKLYIKKTDNMLAKWQVFEKGNVARYDYTISNFSSNVSVTDQVFSFDPKKYPGIEVIE